MLALHSGQCIACELVPVLTHEGTVVEAHHVLTITQGKACSFVHSLIGLLKDLTDAVGILLMHSIERHTTPLFQRELQQIKNLLGWLAVWLACQSCDVRDFLADGLFKIEVNVAMTNLHAVLLIR